MNYRFIVQVEARDELYAATDWYSVQQEGLGEQFFRNVLEAFEEILQHPHNYGFYAQHYRRKRVKGFPYLIIYEIEDNSIYVVRVLYGRRKPL